MLQLRSIAETEMQSRKKAPTKKGGAFWQFNDIELLESFRHLNFDVIDFLCKENVSVGGSWYDSEKQKQKLANARSAALVWMRKRGFSFTVVCAGSELRRSRFPPYS